jgi:hypothetical protein
MPCPILTLRSKGSISSVQLASGRNSAVHPTPLRRLSLSFFCLLVSGEKKRCQLGCSTNGQPCVPCAQSSCASVLPVTSSVKAAEFGKAIPYGPEVTQKAFDHVGPACRIRNTLWDELQFLQRRFRECEDIGSCDDGPATLG